MRTLALALALALVACGDDNPMTGDDDADAAAGGTMTLTLTGVPSLGADAVYEGWAVVGDDPRSTGRFSVDAYGAPQPPSFELPAPLADIDAIVITIEPATGDDPAPSMTKILAGDVAGANVTLTASHAAARGTDFATAAGSFVLATPTTAGDMGDNDQGIWWLVPADTPAPSLTLPSLPDGWIYEGWVASEAGPVSTGRFASGTGADGDGAGPTAGPDGSPPFPGQDFIDPPMVLNGGDVAAVITVEPEPDPAATPFPIKPLVTDPIGAATAPTSQSMTLAIELPAGTAALD